MSDSRAANRYAKALFSLAHSEENLDPVREDLLALGRLIEDSAEFRAFLSNPLLPASASNQVFSTLLEGKANPLTLRFLQLLSERKRLALLPSACEGFEALYDEERGIMRIRVASAQELNAEQQEQLKEKLAARYQKKIEAAFKVKPHLLGGFRIRTGDRVEDYTIATQLELFKKHVMNA